jgi:hypothetical protein
VTPKSASSPSSDLEVTVHTVGGVFGDDRLTRVADQTMTVTNHGAIEAQSELPDSAHQEVTKLARRLAGVRMPELADSDYVPDGGTTTIEVNLPNVHHRIVLNAGDDAPQPVWDLLDGLERIRREAD